MTPYKSPSQQLITQIYLNYIYLNISSTLDILSVVEHTYGDTIIYGRMSIISFLFSSIN
jgi:hypothetical protein